MKKYRNSIIACALIASSFFSMYEAFNLPEPNYLISVQEKGKRRMMLSDSDMINSFVSSSSYSKTQMIEIIHSVLVSKYGNKYLDLAQQRYQQNMGNQNEQSFNQSLQIQGMTPQSYLDSIENYLIIQNEIYKTYHPTKKELKNAYDQLQNEYWIEGIYLTNNSNGDHQESIKDIKEKIKSGKLEFSKLNKHSYDGYSISGIGLNGSITINQISSDDYKTIDSNIKKQLEHSKEGQYITGYDDSFGHYIIKVKKIDKVKSFDKEKSLLSKQIRYQKSNDTNEQTEFVQKLFKEQKVQGLNHDMKELVRNIKRGE